MPPNGCRIFAFRPQTMLNINFGFGMLATHLSSSHRCIERNSNISYLSFSQSRIRVKPWRYCIAEQMQIFYFGNPLLNSAAANFRMKYLSICRTATFFETNEKCSRFRVGEKTKERSETDEAFVEGKCTCVEFSLSSAGNRNGSQWSQM